MSRGQSLIELLIAVGVFILAISAIAFLIIDAYVSDRLGKEMTQATFLAEEGLEQARETGFSSVVSIAPEVIDKFTRTITVINVDSDRKQITSQITWNLTDLRPEEVSLITYLTDWRASVSGSYNYIYALGGNKKKDFWRYDILADSWIAMTDTPNNVDLGGDLIYNEDDYIYALRGDNKKDFWKYTISTDSWTEMANVSGNVKEGGSLVYDGSNYIYALRGNKKKDFWRYDILADSWTAMANAPNNVKDGGDLTYDGSNYIYAFRGDKKKDFWRYDISSNSWTAMANVLANVKLGGDLTYDGSNYIYAFRGDKKKDFWRYDISSNSWTAMADALANVKGGGSVVHDQAGYIYAFRGDKKKDFWRYDISGNSWTAMSDALKNVDLGGDLVFGSGVSIAPPPPSSQADDLIISIVGANIGGGGNKELKGITAQNTGESDLTIAKITVIWDNAKRIEEIKIEGTRIWKHNNEGSPDGKQLSGTEIDVVDYILHIGDTDGFDKFKFDGNMTGVTFNITIEMGDGSTKSTGNFSP